MPVDKTGFGSGYLARLLAQHVQHGNEGSAGQAHIEANNPKLQDIGMTDEEAGRAIQGVLGGMMNNDSFGQGGNGRQGGGSDPDAQPK